jgi:hypothetical protein
VAVRARPRQCVFPARLRIFYERFIQKLRPKVSNLESGELPDDVSPVFAEVDLMADIGFLLATVAFFALSIAYVHFCERIK